MSRVMHAVEEDMGVNPKIVVPQNGWFISWKTLLKLMIWGFSPYFWFNTHMKGKVNHEHRESELLGRFLWEVYNFNWIITYGPCSTLP